MKLNLGCGEIKLPGYINIDMNPWVKPDICANVKQGIPVKDKTADTILMSHMIEHIEYPYIEDLIWEIRRVLKDGGQFILFYPEFEKCVHNFLNNYQGQREFWRMTLFGRQTKPGDYHFSPIVTKLLISLLIRYGFVNIVTAPEPNAEYNTMLKCYKGILHSREEILKKEIFMNTPRLGTEDVESVPTF